MLGFVVKCIVLVILVLLMVVVIVFLVLWLLFGDLVVMIVGFNVMGE